MSMLTPLGAGGRPKVRRGASRARPWVLVVAVVVSLAMVSAAWWWSQRTVDDRLATPTRPSCLPSAAAAPTVVAAASVTVNVYNATKRRGLAARVAGELRRRGFVVGAVADDPLARKVAGVAEVRRGPTGAAAARTVLAHVGRRAAAGGVVETPGSRTGSTVDLVLGNAFRALRTADAAAAALSPTPTSTSKPVSTRRC